MIVVRVLWFILIGFWLGGVVAALAWVLNITIIGLPLGLWLMNRLPSVMTLRPQEQLRVRHGEIHQVVQRLFIQRALYFVFIGWWLSALWLAAAYLLALTVVGIPFAFVMFGRAGAVTTLYRS
jgi:uncharacterized membrane protein YccF (DUF307 family)